MKTLTSLIAIALLAPLLSAPALGSPSMAYFKKKSLLVEKKDRHPNTRRLNPIIKPINKPDRQLHKRDKALNPPPWGHCKAKARPTPKNL